jgi:hypothetical protein
MFYLQVFSFTERFEQPRDGSCNTHRCRLIQVIPEPSITLHGAPGRTWYVRFYRRHREIEMRETMPQNGLDLNPLRDDAHPVLTPCGHLVDVGGLREPPQPAPDTGIRPFLQQYSAIVAHHHDQHYLALRPIALRAWRRDLVYDTTMMRDAPMT